MKRLTGLLLGGLIAASLFTSCIDNEVAPEVTALRDAQVNYINAETAVQEAQARLLAAEAENQEIQNTFDAAMDQITLNYEQADLDARLARLEYELVEAEARLEQEKLDLQQAVDDLSEYLATYGTELAMDYLNDYSNAMDDVYDANEDIYGQIAYIAGLQIAIDNGDFDRARMMIQRDLDDDMAELGVWEETLAAVEAIAVDPTTASAALAAAYATVVELENDYEILDEEADKFESTDVAPAWDAYIKTVGGGSWDGNVTYDDPSEEYADAQDDVIEYTEDIADYEEDIMDDEESIEELQLGITVYSDLLALRQPEAEAYRATADDLYDAYVATEIELAKAESSVDSVNILIDVSRNATDPQLAELWQDYQDAQDSTDEASIAYWDAVAAVPAAEQALADAIEDTTTWQSNYETWLADAEDDLADAEAELDTAQIAFDTLPSQANLDALNNWRANVANAQFWVDNYTELLAELATNLSEAIANLPLAEAALVDAEAALAAAEAAEEAAMTAYDDAVETVDADEAAILDPVLDAYDAAMAAKDEAELAYNNADVNAETAENLVTILEDNISDFNDMIIDVNESIGHTKQNLGEAIADLAEAEAAVLEWEELASLTEVEIADLYAAYLEVDAMWDDMWDELDLIDDQIDGQWRIVNAIENNLDDLNSEIDGIKDDIEDLETSIAASQKLLANEDIDEQELIDQIANEEGYLAQLQEELAAYQALAAEYLALYNAALAG